MDDKSWKQQSPSYYIDINDNDKNKENDSCCNSKWVLVVESPHTESKESSPFSSHVFVKVLSIGRYFLHS